MQKPYETFLESEIDPVFANRARLILEDIASKRPKTILDAGCGRGFYTHAAALFPFVRQVTGIDVNAGYLTVARSHCRSAKITLSQESVYALPFPDRTFDYIICSEVLEHLRDDAGAVAELFRVLKKGGTLAVTVPNRSFPFLWDPLNFLLMRLIGTHVHKDIWWLAGIWADHERLYTRRDLKYILDKRFSSVDIKGIVRWSWPAAHFFLYGIGKNLVERLGLSQFDRFQFSKERPLARLLARIVSLPNRLLDRAVTTKNAVGLVGFAVKTK